MNIGSQAPHIAQTLQRAVTLHRQGNLAEAESLYLLTLASAPEHFDALYYLGVLRLQQRREGDAEKLLAAAVKRKPKDVGALSAFGTALARLARHEEALATFDRLIGLTPGDADAHFNRGVVLATLERHEQALACYRKVLAITPGHAPALFKAGNVLAALGCHAEALASYDQALLANPGDAEILNNRGITLALLGRDEEAIASFNQALASKPGSLDALNNCGNALKRCKRYDEALAVYDQALALKPDHVDSLINRGGVLFELDRPEEALVNLDKAVALLPSDFDVLKNRGLALVASRRYEEAIVTMMQAINVNPGDAGAQSTLGSALLGVDRVDEAVERYDRALAINPEFAAARMGKAFAHLSLGQFAPGWEAYESRFAGDERSVQRPYPQPKWDGRFVQGTLLVWVEQGLGDQILYAGMLPELMSRAQSVVVEIEPRLVPLFARSFPSVQIVPLGDEPYSGSVDMQVAIGSLGRHFRPSWDAFPAREQGYLIADDVHAARLRERLTRDHRAVIGLSWKSTVPRSGRSKSARLADFKALLQLPGCRFVDLQYGDTSEERNAVARDFGVEVERLEDVDNTNDIEGLAALITACDAVVTVSNTTAHLAGALGKPTFVFVPFGNARIWYWFKNKADSPWYPQVKIKRQRDAQPWAELILSVTSEVAAVLDPYLAGGSRQKIDNADDVLANGEPAGILSYLSRTSDDLAALPTGAPPNVRLKRVGKYAGLEPKADFTGHTLIFTHVPKAAGTTLDRILAGIALLRRVQARRIYGTIYGQFLGEGKGEALAEFDALPNEALAACRMLTGHLPFGAHRRLPEPHLYVTMLRNPVTRLMSQFRFGVERGGWHESTSLDELIQRGAIAENGQTRQIAGLADLATPCTAATLDQALTNLRTHYAIVGISEHFDEVLKALITLLRWPDIAYTDSMVTSGAPSPELRDRAERAVQRFFALDLELYAYATKASADLPRLFESNPLVPAHQDQVLVTMEGLKISGRNFALLPTARFEADLVPELRMQGVNIVIA